MTKNRKIKILLVEDDLLSRLSLKSRLEIGGAEVIEACSALEAMELINKHLFELAFVDLDLESSLAGLTVIENLKSKNVHAVVLSGREDEAVIEKAYELGCKDYLSKPFTKESIESVFKRIQNSHKNLVKRLQEVLITEDHDLSFQLKTIENALYGNHPILITGESGTGKTFLAKFIHELIGQEKPFVHLNCSEISENLIESELFGHEKGAFTGAHKNKKGLLELANGGVLFLDEIATLSTNIQKKLLKAIEEKTFYPVGSEKPISSDFRLVSATCENLKDKVAKGEFREDFLFRLDGFNIYLKSLRERRGDLNNLVNFFLKRGKRRIILTTDAREELQNYSWPGNIRELQKVIGVLLSCEKGIIDRPDLEGLINRKAQSPMNHIDIESVKSMGLNIYVERLESYILKEVLASNGDKVRKTMADLKLSNNSFYRIMTNVKSQGVLDVKAE